jgi:hypothetical protein
MNMDPNAPKWKSEQDPTPAELAASRTGAYCSTVEVHANEGYVIHHVEIAEVPNVVGRARKRWFTFQGPNRIVLRVDTPELVAPVAESTLIWERVR